MWNTVETSMDTAGSYISRQEILRQFRDCTPIEDEPLKAYFTKLSNYRIQLDNVSNGSGLPASGPGSDRKNSLLWFQTHSKTRTAASLWAKPIPLPINPQVLPCVARPVGSILRFRFPGFSIYGRIQIFYC